MSAHWQNNTILLLLRVDVANPAAEISAVATMYFSFCNYVVILRAYASM